MNFELGFALRYRIIPTASPGMASEDATDGERETADGTRFAEGFNGILTAGGSKTTRRWCEG